MQFVCNTTHIGISDLYRSNNTCIEIKGNTKGYNEGENEYFKNYSEEIFVNHYLNWTRAY